ncbi:hypothetical protein K2X05_06075, partial [bacterium]|nr:hypothetical protein [bacterium]
KYKALKSPERSEKPNHDLMLVDIRRCLAKRNSVKNYLTENALQCLNVCEENEHLAAYTKANMDAALEIEISKKRYWIALEYENTLQSFEKTDKKLKRFYESEISAMLLVCKTKAQLMQFQNIEGEILKSRNLKSRIYGISLDALLTSTVSINFESQHGKTVSLF